MVGVMRSEDEDVGDDEEEEGGSWGVDWDW